MQTTCDWGKRLSAARTEPYVRDSRIRLPPWPISFSGKIAAEEVALSHRGARDVAGWSRLLPPADARRLSQGELGQHPRPGKARYEGASSLGADVGLPCRATSAPASDTSSERPRRPAVLFCGSDRLPTGRKQHRDAGMFR